MKISKRSINDYLVFDLNENISYETSEELYGFIFNSLETETKKVVLNIERVTYVNSFALGTMIKILQDLEKKDISFFLMKVPAEVKTLLKVTGILNKFRFFEDEH
ncbi:MAG TPA: STAS domain-containing protein [Spirochaetota bacterium]|nr:STAS domain-containing protein [Spirochaetota bacterium]HPR47767.1 STAS domain-containing protein [Spirochaetota bacterium]